jgi:hypothetical protein
MAISSVLLNKTTDKTGGNGTDYVATDIIVYHDEAICINKDAASADIGARSW